jgi:hypothetical protein
MRKVIALIAVLALVGVTGCAESKPDPHEQYAKQVNVVESNFANQINTLALKITPTSTKSQDNQTLEQIKLTVVQTAGKLAAIKVPQDVAAEHTLLVKQLQAYAQSIDPKVGDLSAVTKAQAAQVEAAINSLNAKL